jgi:hypothetical protein
MKLHLDCYYWRELAGVDSRHPIFFPEGKTVHASLLESTFLQFTSELKLHLDYTSFHIVHPRDEFNQIWTNSEDDSVQYSHHLKYNYTKFKRQTFQVSDVTQNSQKNLHVTDSRFKRTIDCFT